jgi:type VI secretion system secreted protein Hcp
MRMACGTKTIYPARGVVREARMAVECFLKIEGPDLTGEAQTRGHEDQIDVLSWSWGLNQNGTLHQPAGGGAGKASVQDLRLTKYLDAASPQLVLACLAGTQFRRATLTCLRVGGDGSRIPYVVIVMQRVIIRAVDDGGSSGDEPSSEDLSLNFAEVIVRYSKQNQDGSAGEEVAIGWSIRENKRLPT